MCCYGQLVTNLVQLDLSVSLFSIFSFQLDPFSRVLSLQCHGLQHARLPYPSPTLRAYSLMSIDLVMPSNHLILSSPSLPAFNLS